MQKANYITREGYLALDRELKYLWKEERPRVTQAVSDAAALGDRSENAEYIYGKRRLREIDRRVRFLTKRLEIQENYIFIESWGPMNSIRRKIGYPSIALLPER